MGHLICIHGVFPMPWRSSRRSRVMFAICPHVHSAFSHCRTTLCQSSSTSLPPFAPRLFLLLSPLPPTIVSASQMVFPGKPHSWKRRGRDWSYSVQSHTSRPSLVHQAAISGRRVAAANISRDTEAASVLMEEREGRGRATGMGSHGRGGMEGRTICESRHACVHILHHFGCSCDLPVLRLLFRSAGLSCR